MAASVLSKTLVQARDPDTIRVESMGEGYFVLCQWDETSGTEHRVVVSAHQDRAMLEAILSKSTDPSD